MSNLILYGGHYSVDLCRQYPKFIWVFGDNLKGFGMGGQAIIRNEPNAVGIPTKRTPDNGPTAFFDDGNTADWLALIMKTRYVEELIRKQRVVIPVTSEQRISLGCGLANLPYHGPLMYAFLERWMQQMMEDHDYAKT